MASGTCCRGTNIVGGWLGESKDKVSNALSHCGSQIGTRPVYGTKEPKLPSSVPTETCQRSPQPGAIRGIIPGINVIGGEHGLTRSGNALKVDLFIHQKSTHPEQLIPFRGILPERCNPLPSSVINRRARLRCLISASIWPKYECSRGDLSRRDYRLTPSRTLVRRLQTPLETIKKTTQNQ
ncbi:hypothetical protein Salat_1708600 [Sesamum alatum]|uniref:Uncharacterized protein n=1 Tax=Sesamum alatum TaxID=300844 RepID=A0AAE2CK55_9LAMI|nr:hypothetical protein Salat_1708600 [Sesamum alatum]